MDRRFAAQLARLRSDDHLREKARAAAEMTVPEEQRLALILQLPPHLQQKAAPLNDPA